ncbi:hypothetical protein BDV3_004439 [Batrachochytrium dendrobatidis]
MFEYVMNAVLGLIPTGNGWAKQFESIVTSHSRSRYSLVCAVAIPAIGILILKRWLQPSLLPKGLPTPPYLPLVGQFFTILPYANRRQTHEFFEKMRKTVGHIWLMKNMSTDIAVVSDPESVMRLLQNSTEITRGEKLQLSAQTMFEHSLFVLPGGPVWKKHRKLLQPAFGPLHLRFAAHASEEAIVQLSMLIEDEIRAADSECYTIDIYQYMTAISMDIMGQVTLKHDFKAVRSVYDQEDSKTPGVFDKLVTFLQRRLFIPPFLWGLVGLHNSSPEIRSTVGSVVNMVKAMIKDYKDAHKNDQSNDIKDKKHMDVLERLLHSNSEAQLFSEQEIIDELIGFIIAGHETTANTMTFIVFALCQNPKVQEKLAAEIHDIYNSLDEELNVDNILRFTYLDWVIKEAQRCYSVVQQVSRVSTQDIQLLGYTFKKGTRFLLRLADVHQDDRYWKDPKQFNPDRWAEPCTPGTFLPFGDGQFNCIGQKMALIEIRVIMIHLIRQFAFDLVPNQKLERFSTVTHGFKNGLKVKMTKRK